MAPADGEGGGNTTPVGGLSVALAEVTVFPAESRESESAVALPRSEFSLGIWTFSWGRFDANAPLFVREGGLISGVDDIEGARVGSVAVLIERGLESGESSGVACVFMV